MNLYVKCYIVGTVTAAMTLIAATIYAIKKIKSGNGSVAHDEPIYEIPEQPKKAHITKKDIGSPNLKTTTFLPTRSLIDITGTENSAEPLLGTDKHIYDVPFESPLLGQYVTVLYIEND
ncbi:hypothetical protein [Candidatus Tisiphia endosymbiont of Hybos culiciformis]|uniref:hypothetical protein n=1 Tax=Candidatus Tisiphia endosymbiont of Hybos culiciformis TaxID=3139331 RepID=UPI003CCAA7A9